MSYNRWDSSEVSRSIDGVSSSIRHQTVKFEENALKDRIFQLKLTMGQTSDPIQYQHLSYLLAEYEEELEVFYEKQRLKRLLSIFLGLVLIVVALFAYLHFRNTNESTVNQSFHQVTQTSSSSTELVSADEEEYDSEDVGSQSADIYAIASGDYSSISGDWFQANNSDSGVRFTSDASYSIGSEGQIRQENSVSFSVTDSQYLIGNISGKISRVGGSAIIFLPAGFELTELHNEEVTDLSDSTRDRFFLTQNIVTTVDDSNVFYRTQD